MKLEKILFNRYLAIPVFLLLMLGVFAITFGFLGDYLSYIIEKSIEFLGNGLIFAIKSLNAPEWFLKFINEAIIGGLGGVLGFLPQVLLLFFALELMEQSGYLVKLSNVLQPMCEKIGLSGRSIFSLLMGFGCTTTALPITKTITNDYARIKTALLLPFMSCSAKLPVFGCIAGAFFGVNSIFVIFALYLLGLIIAILLSIIFQKIAPTPTNENLVLVASLNAPNVLVALKNVGEICLQFIRKIWTIILSFSIVIWVLNNFTISFEYIVNPEKQTSIIEVIASLIAPIFAPLGFGWGEVIALLIGLVAKEMILSTIAVLNGVSSAVVADSLLNAGSIVHFSTASCLSFLVFCLLYTPCVSATAQLKNTVSKKHFVIFLILQFAIAYVVSLLVYNVALMFITQNLNCIFWVFLISVLIGLSTYFVLKYFSNTKKGCKNCNFCNKH